MRFLQRRPDGRSSVIPQIRFPVLASRPSASPRAACAAVSVVLSATSFLPGCGDDVTPPGTGGTGGTASSSGGGSGGGTGTGGSPSGGSTGSTGGGGSVLEVTVTSAGDRHTLTIGNLSLTVDASEGGRIVHFVVTGSETLVQEGGASEYGATFWPSPQTWSWPPSSSIAEIDSDTYTATTTDTTIVLTSADSAYGLRVTKTISGAANGGISVAYGLTNVSGEALDVAPWEISRFSGGLSYYPTGPGGTLDGSEHTPTESGDHSWADFEAYDGPDAKSLADGADGWLAHAVPLTSGSALVVKSFADVPEASIAPEEGEIEIYFAGDGSYLESEQQGTYETLAPGASRTWTVIWNGALLPATTTLTVGSADLVSAAAALL